MKSKELRYLLTQDCNYSCVFCNHEGFYKKPPAKMLPEDYTYLFTVCKSNFDWHEISLTGGEPLLYKDFDKLVNDIRNNQGSITVISNGELLDKHIDTVALLKRVNLSLHTLDQRKYEYLTNRQGSLAKVISNIKTTKANSPHVDVRLNIVLQKGINDEIADIKNILDFASSNNCSIKFIELSNNRDKIVTLEELQNKLETLGLKERVCGKRKTIMSDNVILSRVSCETARRSSNPSKTCRDIMDYFVTPSGTVNLCSTKNNEISILDEVKKRDDEALLTKLKTIDKKFGQNCEYRIKEHNYETKSTCN